MKPNHDNKYMTIREDSGNLLLYIYKYNIDYDDIPSSEQLLTETGWNNNRLNRAVQYLVEKGFVDGQVKRGLGSTTVQAVCFNDITSLGIDIIEAQPEFKQNFGFTVNLGVLQINWGMTES